MDESTSVTPRRSMVEEREATPEGRVALNGARAAVKIISLLNEAFNESGISRQELAHHLGVTEGRVDEILSGDGNLRIATVARVFHILGYKLNFVLAEDSNEIPLA